MKPHSFQFSRPNPLSLVPARFAVESPAYRGTYSKPSLSFTDLSHLPPGSPSLSLALAAYRYYTRVHASSIDRASQGVVSESEVLHLSNQTGPYTVARVPVDGECTRAPMSLEKILAFGVRGKDVPGRISLLFSTSEGSLYVPQGVLDAPAFIKSHCHHLDPLTVGEMQWLLSARLRELHKYRILSYPLDTMANKSQVAYRRRIRRFISSLQPSSHYASLARHVLQPLGLSSVFLLPPLKRTDDDVLTYETKFHLGGMYPRREILYSLPLAPLPGQFQSSPVSPLGSSGAS
jgi:hypothetical protein